MTDHATPNLPSRDYANTIDFYGRLGFETSWHDSNWLILERGGLCLEFFRFPDLDAALKRIHIVQSEAATERTLCRVQIGIAEKLEA